MIDKIFSQRGVLFGILFILFTLCVYPFLFLGYKIVTPDGIFSSRYVFETFAKPSVARAFKNTALVSLVVSLLSIALALPLAWLFTRTTLPGSKKWRSLFCLPYAIPPYIGAIAWVFLANPTTGILTNVLGIPVNIYSFWGLVWVETSFFYTLVLLTLLSSLESMDSSFEEAARLSGASPFQVFLHITMPMIRPALYSGGVLVALASAASFGVPALIGSPAKIYLMTTQIYTYQKMGSMTGIYRAGSLAMGLLFLALGLLVLNHYLMKGASFQTVSGKTSRPSLISLGRWRLAVQVVLCAFLSLFFWLPLGGILWTALSEVQGSLSFKTLGFANFYRIFFETSETARALGNSLYLGLVAASLATLFGLFVAYIHIKTRWKGRGAVGVIASFPYATPGTVLALALILAFSSGIFGVGPSLYNTMAMLWLAYFIKYLNFAVKTVGSGLQQVDDSLAEAARVSGASWIETMKSIWFPLLKPSLVASWFLIFMPAFSELTMTILLTGPGMETVGTLMFQLQEYGDTGGGAAVLALVVVMVVLLTNFLVRFFSKGKYGL